MSVESQSKEKQNDARVKSSTADVMNGGANILNGIANLWGAISGRTPVYQTEVGKYDWFKYLVWLILGGACLYVLYRIFRKKGGKK